VKEQLPLIPASTKAETAAYWLAKIRAMFD
jgi:hypothetical protein